MANAQPSSPFETAFRQFYDSLSQHEQQLYTQCSSSQDLIDGLQKLNVVVLRQKSRRSNHMLQPIADFSNRLQPYFEVVNICIQSKPEVAALVWGSLRLILQLASQYATLFDKVLVLLGRVSQVLPQFDRLAVLNGSQPSPGLVVCLEQVYGDIFAIFHTVAGLFLNRKLEIRRAHSVFGSIIWKPFDVRFGEIITRLQDHQAIIRCEVAVMTAEMSNQAEVAAAQERSRADLERHRAEEARKKIDCMADASQATLRLLEQQEQERALSRIRKWIGSSKSECVLEKCQQEREEGTNRWIFNNNQFILWKDREAQAADTSARARLGPNVLWLSGNPGSGKSVLASSIVYEFRKTAVDQRASHTVYHYFFQADDPDAQLVRSAYQAILSQALSHSNVAREMVDVFTFAAADAAKDNTATQQELLDLVLRCLEHDPQPFVILDGLDECGEVSHLTKDLKLLSSRTKAKFLLLSRPNVACLSVRKAMSLIMDRSKLSDDIRSFLNREIEELVEDELLPDREYHDEFVSHLVKGADGMFLWARLMVRYLRSPALTPGMRLRTIKSVILPEGLHTMYDRILNLVGQSGHSSQHLARRIFGYMVYARRQLDVTELEDAILSSVGSSDDETERFTDFTGSAIIVCGGLVESYAGRNGKSMLRFMHLSVKEHFQSGHSAAGSDRQDCIPPKWAAHANIARDCLQHIAKTAPNVPRGNEYLQVQIHKPSWYTYAVAYWIEHLAAMQDAEMDKAGPCTELAEVMTALKRFISDPLMVSCWLEAVFTNKYRHFESSAFEEGILEPDLTRIIKSGLTGGHEYTVTTAMQNENLLLDSLESWTIWAESVIGSNIPLSTWTDLRDFTRDMRTFIGEWSEHLMRDPTMVWRDASLFSLSRFTYQNEARALALRPEPLKGEKTSSRPLCTVSSTSEKGDYTVIIDVWPSSQFEANWSTLETRESFATIERYCTDWVARVQVWSTGGRPTPIAEARVPIDKGELVLLMRQSFRCLHSDAWRTSFPLAIAPGAHFATILRTLYHFNYNGEKQKLRYSASVVSLDFLRDYRAKWSGDLKSFNPQARGLADLPPALLNLHRDKYTYVFRFNEDGSRLLFCDYPDMFQARIAALRVSLLHGTPTTRLIDQTTIWGRPKILSDALFHPNGLVIALDASGFTVDFLFWKYEERTSVGSLIRSSDGETNEPSSIRYLARLGSEPKLSLSTCGRFAIASGDGKSVVVQIPGGEEARSTGPECTEDPTLQPSRASINVDLSTKLARSSGPGSGRVLSRSGGLQDLSTTDEQVVFLRDDGMVQVVGMRKDGDGKDEVAETLQFVHVPKTQDKHGFRGSIKIPSGEERTLRLYMDLEPSTVYSFGAQKQPIYPYILDRSLETLQKISLKRSCEDDSVMPMYCGASNGLDDKVILPFDEGMGSRRSAYLQPASIPYLKPLGKRRKLLEDDISSRASCGNLGPMGVGRFESLAVPQQSCHEQDEHEHSD